MYVNSAKGKPVRARTNLDKYSDAALQKQGTIAPIASSSVTAIQGLQESFYASGGLPNFENKYAE